MSTPASELERPSYVHYEDDVPVLAVPEDLAFEALKDWVKRDLRSASKELEGRTCRLDLGDRGLVLYDIRRLVHLLEETYGAEVTGLYARRDAIERFAERELKLMLFPKDPPDEVTEEVWFDADDENSAEAERAQAEPSDEDASPDAAAPASDDDAGADDDDASADGDDAEEEDEDEDEPSAAETQAADTDPQPPTTGPVRMGAIHAGTRTQTVRRTLRSGNALRFDGDVLLFGDVNPGAEVIASGNIVVLGSLKGMAHAGASGDESAFILSLDMRPTQIRIGPKIAVPAESPTQSRPDPEIAQITDGQIVIEHHRGRP